MILLIPSLPNSNAKWRMVCLVISIQVLAMTCILCIALAIRSFIESSPSQLTYYGLFTLAAELEPGALVALFRSSHLSVLYKAPGADGALYTLATDQVFLHEGSVVWERLEDIDGGSSTFVDSDFVRASPAGGDFAGHTAESALAALEQQTRGLTLAESAE